MGGGSQRTAKTSLFSRKKKEKVGCLEHEEGSKITGFMALYRVYGFWCSLKFVPRLIFPNKFCRLPLWIRAERAEIMC